MRFAAALMVVFTHFAGRTDNVEWLPFGPWGGNGVAVFFVLSGYLLWRPFVMGHPDPFRYMVNRAARILPAWWLAAIGLAFLARGNILYTAFMLPTGDYLGIVWTLRAEVMFYVAVPLLALIGRPLLVPVVLGVASLALDLSLGGARGSEIEAFLPVRFWSFALGMILAATLFRPGRLSLAAGITLLSIGAATNGAWGGQWTNLSTYAGAFFVVAWGINARIPYVRLWVAGAAISYALYLWHADLLDMFGPIGLPLAIGTAILSYELFEGPVLRWAHRRRERPVHEADTPITAPFADPRRHRRRAIVAWGLAATLAVGYFGENLAIAQPRRVIEAGRGAAFPASPVVGARYALFNGQNGDGEVKIGAATYDPDTDTWAEEPSPVLTAAGGWEGDLIHAPCLVWDGSEFVVYYDGYDGTKYEIGRATAPSWPPTLTKYGSNPVLAVGGSGAFDVAGVNFPTVIYEPWDAGKRWKMWYGANNGAASGDGSGGIGFAYSDDGLAWTKIGQVLAPGATGTWEDVGLLPLTVYRSGATYYLFYGGRQGVSAPADPPRWQGGIATFTDPERTYTRHGSNPVLLSRGADGDTSVVPTADVTAGATTVSLADTSPFNVGEPVTLADGDSTAEHFFVVSKSATAITLDRPVVGNLTGGGKAFRSFAYNSALPRSVMPSAAGGWEMFGTPFQPVDDLTQPASKLWEGAFRWTADDLTGPWDYDYVAGRGLLFPFTVSWHSRSAENPSVIAAP